MANYEKMVEARKHKAEEVRQRVIIAIEELLASGTPINTNEVVKASGVSLSYIAHNEELKRYITEVKIKQNREDEIIKLRRHVSELDKKVSQMISPKQYHDLQEKYDELYEGKLIKVIEGI